MGCEAVNENCFQESPEFRSPEVGDQYNNSDECSIHSLQKDVDSDNGKPPVKTHGCDIETTGVINPSADGNVHDDPILVVTPEWQRRGWLLEVSQSAEDNPESVNSFNSDNESDGGSWTFEDGPDANLKIHELQIQNMTSICEAMEARARKAEKEISDNDKAFKEQLNDSYFKHAESMQAQQDQFDTERAEALNIRKELLRENDHLKVQYRRACAQIKDQNDEINELDARVSGYIEVLKQVKAPDGSVYTHKQRQGTIDDLKRDANAQKEFYKNQIKTLENQVARRTARLNKGTEESRNLQQKLQTLSTELSDEQQKFRDIEAKLELERKRRLDIEETNKKNFETWGRDTQIALVNRDERIRQMENIIGNLQAHLVTAQQSYAAAMDTATNFHRAHEKIIQENRELVIQHRHAMELFANDHKSVCDSNSQNEAVLREEIATLQKRLDLMGDNDSLEQSQCKAIVDAMKQEILGLREELLAAKHTLEKRDRKYIALPPGNPLKKQVGGSWAPEALDALAETQANAIGMRLDKGKGIADDIIEKRSGEAVKDPAELPGSEFSKLQATFRKGMAEAEMGQDPKKKPTSKSEQSVQPTQPSKPTPTPKAMHPSQSTQPLKPKPTPVVVHSYKPTQPSQQPKPASVPTPSHGQPLKVPTTSKIPTPAKTQPRNQVKETLPVEAPPAYSRSFTIPHDAPCWMKAHHAPAIASGVVAVASEEVERGGPIPLSIFEEQKLAAQGNNQA